MESRTTTIIIRSYVTHLNGNGTSHDISMMFHLLPTSRMHEQNTQKIVIQISLFAVTVPPYDYCVIAAIAIMNRIQILLCTHCLWSQRHYTTRIFFFSLFSWRMCLIVFNHWLINFFCAFSLRQLCPLSNFLNDGICIIAVFCVSAIWHIRGRYLFIDIFLIWINTNCPVVSGQCASDSSVNLL